MPSNKDAAYARFRADFIPKLHGCVSETNYRLGFHHSNSVTSVDCCDPKQPYPPFTDDWVYGLPPNERKLRIILDYLEPDWIPVVTVSRQVPGAICQQVYSGSDVAIAMNNIREAIEQLHNVAS